MGFSLTFLAYPSFFWVSPSLLWVLLRSFGFLPHFYGFSLTLFDFSLTFMDYPSLLWVSPSLLWVLLRSFGFLPYSFAFLPHSFSFLPHSYWIFSTYRLHLLSSLLLVSDGLEAELLQVSVEDVDIDIAFDAGDGAFFGELPHEPIVFDVFDEEIVVGYPEIVIGEFFFEEVVVVAFAGIDDGFFAIVLFYSFEPTP